MKTKELVDKYKKIISGLFDKAKPEDVKILTEVQIWDDHPTKSHMEWKEVGDLVYTKPNDESWSNETVQNNWSMGNYRISIRGHEAASFKLYQMPHCCGIMVSCNAAVAISYRNKRLGTTLNSMRQDIGRIRGYSVVLCTDITTNEHQRKLLATQGWKDIHSFINKRTNNTIVISVIGI